MWKVSKILIFILWVVVGIWVLLFWQSLVGWSLVSYRTVGMDVDTLFWSLNDSIHWYDIKNSEYGQFDNVFDILKTNYYDSWLVDHAVMKDAALKSYVNALRDPFTAYLDAEENSWLYEILQWEEDFEGIWAVVAKKDEWVLIQELLKDSPWYKAWLKPLDIIIKVDDTLVIDMPINDAIKLIRGPKWSQTVLTLLRTKENWDKELLEKEVIRDTISVPSVHSKIIEKNNKKYGYISISIVGEETEKLLRHEISLLKDNILDGLVLDLRGNWWWLLWVAVTILSHFVDEWVLVVDAKYTILDDESYYAKWPKDFWDLPIVVLVDWMTASAWEIIALALKEVNGSKIVWSTTFGKWSIQTIHDFEDWSALKYTIWKWYSPSWVNVDKVWIEPDVAVEFDVDKFVESWEDNQLEKAIEIF